MSIAQEAPALLARYGRLDGSPLLRMLLTRQPLAGRLALVSSFGAESVVLLHMVAQIDRATPVIFLDTLKHFPATIAYRDELVARLGLRDVRGAFPDARSLQKYDPRGDLHASEPDACCHIRKTEPLEEALQSFAAWITGRKRFQGGLREDLPLIEEDPAADRLKINPLARWSAAELDAYRREHDLPPHPLVAEGYRSIGCAPCTRPTGDGESARAGRWFGIDKVECGIHLGGGAAREPERRAA